MADKEPPNQPPKPPGPAEDPHDPEQPEPQVSGPDQPTPAAESEPQREEPESPARRRRLWKGVGIGLVAVLLIVVVLVALLPTLLSTGPGRSWALSFANRQIDGSLQVQDWSLGWFSPVTLRGVRLFDDRGAQIVEAGSVTTTELTVWNILRGRFDFGEAQVQGAVVDFRIYEDGTTNFHWLMDPDATEPFAFPDTSGRLTADLRATIERPGVPPVIVDRGDIRLQIPNINEPIVNRIELAVRVGDGPPGQVVAEGSIQAIRDYLIDIDRLWADQVVQLADVDLAPVMAMAPPGGPIDQLRGVTSGRLNLAADGQGVFIVEMDATSSGFAIAGPALEGEQYTSQQVRIQIPPTRLDTRTMRLRTGAADELLPLRITLDDGFITLAADVPLEMPEAPAPGPGVAAAPALQPGSLRYELALNLPGLSAKIPQTMGLQPGVSIESGQLDSSGTVQLGAAGANLDLVLNLPDLAGRDTAGQPVRIEPVNLSVQGRLDEQWAPADVAARLQSGFANVQLAAGRVDQLSAEGRIDLAEFQREVGQLWDLGEIQMAGVATFNAASEGDLADPGGTAQLTLGATIEELALLGVMGEYPLQERWMRLELAGQLERGAEGEFFLRRVRELVLTVLTDSPDAPVVDVHALADVELITPPTAAPGEPPAPAFELAIPRFRIERANVQLAAAQRNYAALLEPLIERGLIINSGAVSISGGGSLAGTQAALDDLVIRSSDVTLIQRQEGVADRPVVLGYTGVAQVGGTVDLADGLTAALTQLDVSDQAGLLALRRTGEAPLTITMLEGPRISAGGNIAFEGNLPPIMEILTALGAEPADPSAPPPPPPAANAAPAEPGTILAGRVAGNLALAPINGGTSANGQINLINLAIATHADPVQEERLALEIDAMLAEDLSMLAAQRIALQSALATATITDARVVLLPPPSPGGEAVVVLSPLQRIERATVAFEIPQVPRIAALAEAFSPAVPPPPDPQQLPPDVPAEEIELLPPLVFVEGSVAGNLAIARNGSDLAINIASLSGRRLTVQRGDGRFGPDQFEVAGEMLVRADFSDPAAPLAAQIRQLQVSRLAARVGRPQAPLVDLNVTEPLLVSDPLGTPVAQGVISATGQIERIAALFEALEAHAPGSVYQYAGRYTLQQSFGTQQDVFRAQGNVEVADFRVGPANQPTFREPAINLVNNLIVDRGADALSIQQLSLAMPQSRALDVNVTGAIRNLQTQRNFDDLRIVLGYDAAAAWQIVRPILSAELQETLAGLEVAGVVRDRVFVVSGNYPAVTEPDPTGALARQSIRGLVASGVLNFDRVVYKGIPAENIEVPISLRDGRLRTIYADRQGPARFPQPFPFGGGTADIGGLVLSLHTTHPRLSAMRPNHQVLRGVQVQEQFLADVLGSYHPLFAGAVDARGTMDLTIAEAEDLPIGGHLFTARQQDRGRAVVRLAFPELAMSNQLVGLLSQQLRLPVNPDGTLPVSIREAQVTLGGGRAESVLNMMVGRHSLNFDGIVGLTDLQIVRMNMQLPAGLIPFLDGVVGEQETFIVPLTGSVTSPSLNVREFVMQEVQRRFGPAMLQRLLRGGAAPNGQPPANGDAAPPPRQPPRIEDLIFGPRRPPPPEEEPPGTIGRPVPQQPSDNSAPAPAPPTRE